MNGHAGFQQVGENHCISTQKELFTIFTTLHSNYTLLASVFSFVQGIQKKMLFTRDLNYTRFFVQL